MADLIPPSDISPEETVACNAEIRRLVLVVAQQQAEIERLREANKRLRTGFAELERLVSEFVCAKAGGS